MQLVLMNPEGKKVVVDTTTDPRLYKAPHNPPDTGMSFTMGTDLYAHKARSGNWYYYFLPWSMWQGEDPQPELITREDAEAFLLDKAGHVGYGGLGDREIEALLEYGFDLLDEDA